MQTLKTKKEFDFVYKNGFLRYGKAFALYVYKDRNNMQHLAKTPSSKIQAEIPAILAANSTKRIAQKQLTKTKIGLSVSKKIGNAVMRNKIKRRVRAILRDIREIALGFRIIFVAKAGINELSFTELKNSFIITLNFVLEKLNKGYKKPVSNKPNSNAK